jgi:hypothetical protein
MQIRMPDVDIIYFNLDRQPHRAIDLEKDLKQYKLKKPRRISAVDRELLTDQNTHGYVDDGIGFYHSIAVARSYLKALDAAPSTPFLILEDDARIASYEPVIDIPDDADAIYLGINEFAMDAEDVYAGFKSWKPGFVSFDRSIGNEDFYRIYRSLGCHAILYITDRFVDAAKAAFEESSRTGIPIDIMQNRLQQEYNCYVSADNMFVQDQTPITYSDLRYYTAPKETPRIGSN